MSDSESSDDEISPPPQVINEKCNNCEINDINTKYSNKCKSCHYFLQQTLFIIENHKGRVFIGMDYGDPIDSYYQHFKICRFNLEYNENIYEIYLD